MSLLVLAYVTPYGGTLIIPHLGLQPAAVGAWSSEPRRRHQHSRKPELLNLAVWKKPESNLTGLLVANGTAAHLGLESHNTKR